MRFYATVLIVACCLVTLAGCCGRGHRHWCPFSKRHHHRHCVDQNRWDSCDDCNYDYDDDDDGCSCGCHSGHGAPQYGPPMPSFDTGCGCGGEMPTYFGDGMPMSYDSFPSSSGCASCGGGAMSMPSYPTFDQPVMMTTPTPTPTPTPAVPPSAPAAESYYAPGSSNSTTAIMVPPKY